MFAKFCKTFAGPTASVIDFWPPKQALVTEYIGQAPNMRADSSLFANT